MLPAGAQATPAPAGCGARADLQKADVRGWAALRDECQRELDAYLASDPVGFVWFANAANGFTGIPYVVLRVLPDLAPDIWGRPESRFARFGLFPEPDAPDRPLPRGLGIASTAGRPTGKDGRLLGEIDFARKAEGREPLHVVSLSCGSCHSGRVMVDGQPRVLEGGANTQFDVRKWREAFTLTVERYLSSREKITATAGRIAAIIDAKPAGYFYPAGVFSGPGFLNFSADQTEKAQRVLVKAALPAILEQLAVGTYVRKAGVDLQAHTSYGHWNGPGLAYHSTGQMDGSGDLITQLLAQRTAAAEGWTFDRLSDPGFDGVRRFLATPFDALPPFATNTDIPSVWNQQARKVGQWDGSVGMPFWRNLAAQFPIIGDPGKVDLHNSGISANFLHGLPPAPYPFDVDMTRAARGEGLFRDHCQVCHKPLNDTVHGFRSVGTDMNRASVLNGPALAMFLGGFSASCNTPGFTYARPDGRTVEPCAMNGTDIVADRTSPDAQGYVASVLDGIWARAPYLHNGSVPTLRHLLVPQERPGRFLRGAIEYDRADVGWMWQLDRAGRVSDAAPTLMVFDVTRDGASNAGHDRDLMVDGALRRLDWGRPEHAEALKDLLEYLKTQ